MIRAKWRYRKDGNAYLVTRGKTFRAKRNLGGMFVVYREQAQGDFVIAISDSLDNARREIDRLTNWTKP